MSPKELGLPRPAEVITGIAGFWEDRAPLSATISYVPIFLSDSSNQDLHFPKAFTQGAGPLYAGCYPTLTSLLP